MKKILISVLVLVILTGLVSCGQTTEMQTVQEAEAQKHLIGVVVYDLADEQVQAFREYLEQYIAASFQDVSFLYSQSIQTSEEEMDFIGKCIDAGAEGILAFNSFDLSAEVALCADHQVYYMRPSATVAAADFEQVADNPYFLGYFGPGEEMEYEEGYRMGQWFINQSYGNTYFVVSGGAPLGNTMHIERTRGILEALAAGYGVEFSESIVDMAVKSTPETYEAGELKVTVCGGYVASEPFLSTARTAYQENPSDVVLSVLPLGDLTAEVEGARLGLIDFYSGTNSQLFQQGRLQYVSGKYSSIIGPAFAAMYNAVTGHAEKFRDNGRAFRIIQGFWTSDNKEDYEEKYVLSSGIAKNAYSYDDLLSVVKDSNPDAGYQNLLNLAGAWDYESAAERRK